MGSRAGDDHTANTNKENLPNDSPSSFLGYCWNLAPRVPASLGALQAQVGRSSLLVEWRLWGQEALQLLSEVTLLFFLLTILVHLP